MIQSDVLNQAWRRVGRPLIALGYLGGFAALACVLLGFVYVGFALALVALFLALVARFLLHRRLNYLADVSTGRRPGLDHEVLKGVRHSQYE